MDLKELKDKILDALYSALLITIAEPDLQVLAGLVSAVMNGTLLIYAVGFGVVTLVAMIPLITIQLLGFKGIIDAHVQERKAVILSVVREDLVEPIMETLEDKFATIKNGKGIAFSLPVSEAVGLAAAPAAEKPAE